MNNKQPKEVPVELEDKALDAVTGGSMWDDPNIEWVTCSYCAGRIVFRKYGVDVPRTEIKCGGCGYMPSDPSTIPDMDTIIGG